MKQIIQDLWTEIRGHEIRNSDLSTVTSVKVEDRSQIVRNYAKSIPTEEVNGTVA